MAEGNYWQVLTNEQEDYIEKNFDFTRRDKEAGKQYKLYCSPEDTTFTLTKDRDKKIKLAISIRLTVDGVKQICIIWNEWKNGQFHPTKEKQPVRLVERLMRHYPPHTNIYEREMIGNSARNLDLELKKNNEPEQVKKKVPKV